MGDAAGVAKSAIGRGLAARTLAIDTVDVTGPVLSVLGFAATVRTTEVNVSADARALRWIPDIRPTLPIPIPGAPYRTAPLIVDRSDLQMEPAEQNAFVRLLAASIVTIDGAPYDRITVSGSCSRQPPACELRAVGSTASSGGQPDGYDMLSDETTRQLPGLVSSGFEGVPRALAREAEWIARHDVKGAAAVAAYRDCCGAWWDPARPGQIRLEYTRQCIAGMAPEGIALAETGSCVDLLTIVVDVSAGSVMSIEQKAGP